MKPYSCLDVDIVMWHNENKNYIQNTSLASKCIFKILPIIAQHSVLVYYWGHLIYFHCFYSNYSKVCFSLALQYTSQWKKHTAVTALEDLFSLCVICQKFAFQMTISLLLLFRKYLAISLCRVEYLSPSFQPFCIYSTIFLSSSAGKNPDSYVQSNYLKVTLTK